MARRTLPSILLAAVVACSGGRGPTAIEIPIVRIDIIQGCAVIVDGEECQITVAAFTTDGRQVANPVLRWISTNSAVADVNSRGRVFARAPGTATIVVSNSTGSVTDETRVAVVPRGNK